ACRISPSRSLMHVITRAASVFLAGFASATLMAQQAAAPPGPPPGFPPPTPGGPGVFQRACAACHVNPASDSRAPNPGALAQFAPDAIVNALTTGAMRLQGEKLSETERREVAEFLTGRPVGRAS